MANDARIPKESGNIVLPELGHGSGVKVGEDLTKPFSFSQDGEPRQTGLKTFEADLLKQTTIVDLWSTPLVVVVVEIVRILPWPPAPSATIVAYPEPVAHNMTPKTKAANDARRPSPPVAPRTAAEEVRECTAAARPLSITNSNFTPSVAS